MPSKIQKSYSKKQIREYLKKFDESGMTLAGFCKQNQIASSTFGYWRKMDKAGNSKPKFMEVKVKQQKENSMEIKLPNGIQAKITSADQVKLVKSLMEINHA